MASIQVVGSHEKIPMVVALGPAGLHPENPGRGTIVEKMEARAAKTISIIIKCKMGEIIGRIPDAYADKISKGQAIEINLN